MRFIQGFFACCLKQDDFVFLVAAPQFDFQVQPGLGGREPLTFSEWLYLHPEALVRMSPVLLARTSPVSDRGGGR